MKKSLLVLVAAAMALAFSGGAFAKDMKVAYVDVFKVFNDYKKTQDYESSLKVKQERQENRLKEKQDEIKQMQGKLDLLKEDEKAKERDKIENMAIDLQRDARKVAEDLQKERADKMKSLVADVDKIIAAYAKKNGYDLIVNKTAVLYADNSMDITGDITGIANKQYVPGK